ncbi:hypothetical protein ACMHYB_09450 [Sorangium sp. So ce1128]
MPTLVRSCAPPRGYEPGVFFGFLVALDVDLLNVITSLRRGGAE